MKAKNSLFISLCLFTVIPAAGAWAAGAADPADSGMIVSRPGRIAVYKGREYRGYDGLRLIFTVSRDPHPMGLLLKSRENFILGVSLAITGGLVAALMAPVVYDPDDYSLAPPIFVFPIGVGVTGAGGIFLAAAHHRWKKSISLYNDSLRPGQ